MGNVADVPIDENIRWFGNSLVSLQLRAAAGEDQISVIEQWIPFGEAPPHHIHRNQDEIFHILEGRIRFLVGNNETVVGPGETILAPKGIAHSFRVESDGAHCLTITCGRDFETMVNECSRPTTSRVLPPFLAPSPAALDHLMSCCTRNHIDIVAPPMERHQALCVRQGFASRRGAPS
jgi:quercetin dioxygenase-like cupin family protein